MLTACSKRDLFRVKSSSPGPPYGPFIAIIIKIMRFIRPATKPIYQWHTFHIAIHHCQCPFLLLFIQISLIPQLRVLFHSILLPICGRLYRDRVAADATLRCGWIVYVDMRADQRTAVLWANFSSLCTRFSPDSNQNTIINTNHC